MTRRLWWSSAFAPIVFAQAFANPALAQDKTAVSEAQTGIAGDIVVTARRRRESLLSIPAAVSAVSGDALQARGIVDFKGLQQTTPNLQVTDNSGFGRPFLRGVGSAIFNTGAESSIAVYIDDVPRPRFTGLSSDLGIVDRVEILRGPQGGLYGRNATGGAINIVTRTPGDALEARGRVAFGNYDALEAESYLAGPLAEGLSLGIGFAHREHAPYARNVAGGPDLENANSDTLSAKLVFNPAGWLKATLAGDYSWIDDSRGLGFRQLAPGSRAALAPLVASGDLPGILSQGTVASAFYGALLAGGCAQANGVGACDAAQLGGFFGQAGGAILAAVPDFRGSSDPLRLTLNGNPDPQRKVRDYGGSLRLDADAGFADVTSLTSLREHRWTSRTDFDATNVPFLGFYATIRSQTFTQELRLASKEAAPISWIVGANYFHDEVDNSLGGTVLGTSPPSLLTISRLVTDACAAFAQGRWQIDDVFALTVSGRYSHERKTIAYPAQASTSNLPIDGARNWDDLSPSATLEARLSPKALIYLRYARGFKSGGINSFVAPTFLGGVNTFRPEKIDSIEAGFRGRLFGDRMRFTTAAFYYWYRDIQIERLGGPAGGATITLNADRARIYGLEADATVSLLPALTLSAAAGYLDAKYTDYSIDAATASRLFIAPVNNTGRRLPFSPRFTANVGLDLDQPLSDAVALTGSVSVSYKGLTYFEAENRRLTSQGAYAVVNARLGVKSASTDRWQLSLFANNLFNRNYLALAQTGAAGVFATDGAPRTYGVSLQGSW